MPVEDFFESLLREVLERELSSRDEQDLVRLTSTEGWTRVISESSRTIGIALADSLVESSTLMLAERRGSEAHTSEEVRRLYGVGLDLCEMVLRIAAEMGEEYVDRHFGTEGVPATEWVLGHLQARACRVAEEALLLLKAGFGLGAFSRWRALHEIVVVGTFIAQHGDELAVRYFEHLAVDRLRALRLASEYAHRRKGDDLPDPAELQKLQVDIDALVARYGKAFLGDYGWAADALNTVDPQPQHRGFRRLEAAVKFDHLRTNYHAASSAVHAGPALVLDPPDAYHLGSTLLTGPSLMAIATPAHAVAVALLQSTGTLLTSKQSWAAPFVLATMSELTDRAGEALVESSAKAERYAGSDA